MDEVWFLKVIEVFAQRDAGNGSQARSESHVIWLLHVSRDMCGVEAPASNNGISEYVPQATFALVTY